MKSRCWHFWRWRHKYVYGKHCDQCCATFRYHSALIYLYPKPLKKIGE